MSNGHSIFECRHDGQSKIVGAGALIATGSQSGVVSPVEFARQVRVIGLAGQDGNVAEKIQMSFVEMIDGRVGVDGLRGSMMIG